MIEFWQWVVPIRLWWNQKYAPDQHWRQTTPPFSAVKGVPIRLWWNQKFESGIRSIVNRRVPIRLWWNQKCGSWCWRDCEFPSSNSTMVKSEVRKLVLAWLWISQFQFDYGEIRRVRVCSRSNAALSFQFDYDEIRSQRVECLALSRLLCSNSTMVKSEGAFRSGLGLRVRSSNSTMMKSEG